MLTVLAWVLGVPTYFGIGATIGVWTHHILAVKGWQGKVDREMVGAMLTLFWPIVGPITLAVVGINYTIVPLVERLMLVHNDVETKGIARWKELNTEKQLLLKAKYDADHAIDPWR